MASSLTLAAVEGGGTSFKVAVCRVDGEQTPIIIQRTEISSQNPQETLQQCADFLATYKPRQGYHALGIACFGPLGVKFDDRSTYGTVLTSSPKAAWRDVDVLTPLRQACQGSQTLAVRVDTDVNAPAVAEYQATKTKNLSSLAYVTIGTGVGVGLVVHGKAVHGRMHPEGGHVPIQPLEQDSFQGYSWNDTSPFGGKHTVEGMASSVALTERLAQLQTTTQMVDRSQLALLPDNHEVWNHAANAIANLCATLHLLLSMERIVLGGGIMNRPGLLEKVRERTLTLLNGYLPEPDAIAASIVTSQYGADAGLQGAIVLAHRAYLEDSGTEQDSREREMKQASFGYGLRFGLMIGAVSTALLMKHLRKR